MLIRQNVSCSFVQVTCLMKYMKNLKSLLGHFSAIPACQCAIIIRPNNQTIKTASATLILHCTKHLVKIWEWTSIQYHCGIIDCHGGLEDISAGSVTYCSGSHVFAAVWDLRLVGVVGTADHWTGGRQAVTPHHTAAGLTWRHAALPQFPVARAGWAPFGVHDGHGRPTFIVENSRAQTHRDSYKEYSANTWSLHYTENPGYTRGCAVNCKDYQGTLASAETLMWCSDWESPAGHKLKDYQDREQGAVYPSFTSCLTRHTGTADNRPTVMQWWEQSTKWYPGLSWSVWKLKHGTLSCTPQMTGAKRGWERLLLKLGNFKNLSTWDWTWLATISIRQQKLHQSEHPYIESRNQ